MTAVPEDRLLALRHVVDMHRVSILVGTLGP